MRIDRRVRLGLVALFLLASVVIFTATRPATVPGPLTPDGYRVTAGAHGPMLTFAAAEFNLSTARTPPVSGWWKHELPDINLVEPARAAHLAPPTVWIRMRFDRASLGTRPIALYGALFCEDFILYLNGAEIYRTRGDDDRATFAWNQPLFVWLPPAMLHPDRNELLVRVQSENTQRLGSGTVWIGADNDIRTAYDRGYFFTNIAPQIISGYLLILTIGAVSFWIKRPTERVYLWLAFLGIAGIFRNLLYFAVEPPFAASVFWPLISDSSFILNFALFSFAISYFALPRSRFLLTLLTGACVAMALLRHGLIASGHSALLSYVMMIPHTLFMLVMIFAACRRRPVFGNWLMFGAMLLTVLFAYHDIIFTFDIASGLGLYLVPYGGLLVFAAFDAALTSRLQNALIDVEDVNLKLEARVADVTRSLAQSEAARAELQVAQAVGQERDRIMREIHDGIGSSLLTALTGAKLRGESPETVATLTRSLTDLRIGVDSLEPVDGDVVALLANLRHRMERELKGAGFTFVWRVDACPRLPWLDPVSALHVLRIVQEAIGNAVAHSEAKQVEVRCHPRAREGAPGILIEIADTGAGFDPDTPSRGKGLANMAARAEALSVHFRADSKQGAGTRIAIWLPVAKG
jgi:signal transduction histidine kinase